MILFDGAMGTMLQRFGLDAGGCPDYYNISHPEIVQEIHKAYVNAGSQYITTNTFGSSPLKLSDYDLSDKTEEIAADVAKNPEKTAEQWKELSKIAVALLSIPSLAAAHEGKLTDELRKSLIEAGIEDMYSPVNVDPKINPVLPWLKPTDIEPPIPKK